MQESHTQYDHRLSTITTTTTEAHDDGSFLIIADDGPANVLIRSICITSIDAYCIYRPKADRCCHT